MTEGSKTSDRSDVGSNAAPMGVERMPAARRYLMIELAVAVLAAVIYFFGSEFQLELGATVMAYALLALSMDFTWGCTGIMSLGQAFFFGVGAYVGGLLATEADISSALVTLPAAMLVTFAFALAIGAFLLAGAQRTTVLFVSIATLVLSFISQRIADAWNAIGAENGIPSVPELTIGPLTIDVRGNYVLAFVAMAGAYVALQFVVRSQFGLVLVAVRDDEQRAMFLGYRPTLVKLFAFSVAGAVAGLGGVLYAFQQGFVSPTLLAVGLSTQAMLWVLIGGAGTLIGPVVGVILVQGLGQYLSQDMPKLWPIVLGVVLLVVVLAVQRGVVGWFLPRAPIRPPRPAEALGSSRQRAARHG